MKYKYAVNLTDLMSFPPVLLPFLLPPEAAPSRLVVDAEPGRIDGKALLFELEPEDRCVALIRGLRKLAERHLRYKLRAYASKTGRSWRRLP